MMLPFISWQQYLLALLIALAIYYLIIVWYYYRQVLRQWVVSLQGRRSRLRSEITGRTGLEDTGDRSDDGDTDARISPMANDDLSDHSENSLTAD